MHFIDCDPPADGSPEAKSFVTGVRNAVEPLAREAELGYRFGRKGFALAVRPVTARLSTTLSFEHEGSGKKARVDLIARSRTGNHGQAVVDGLHPDSGKPYVWQQDHCPRVLPETNFDALPLAADTDFDEAWVGIIKAVEVYGWFPVGGSRAHRVDKMGEFRASPQTQRAPDLDTLHKALLSLPNGPRDEYRDFQSWLGMLYATVAASNKAPETREAFLNWTARFDPDPDKIEKAGRLWDDIDPGGCINGWPMIERRARRFRKPEDDFLDLTAGNSSDQALASPRRRGTSISIPTLRLTEPAGGPVAALSQRASFYSADWCYGIRRHN